MKRKKTHGKNGTFMKTESFVFLNDGFIVGENCKYGMGDLRES